MENGCAFTGHRPHKLPWKYNEGDARCVALKTALKEQIIIDPATLHITYENPIL